MTGVQVVLRVMIVPLSKANFMFRAATSSAVPCVAARPSLAIALTRKKPLRTLDLAILETSVPGQNQPIGN